MPKFKGVEFDFGGGLIYIIPPLAVTDLKRYRRELATLQKNDVDHTAGVDACITLVHAALRRNYPEMTRDEVEAFLDMSNMLAAIKCVMNFHGLPGNLAQAGNLPKTNQGVDHGK